MFGNTRYDEQIFTDEGRVADSANPWARQAQADLDSLQEVEAGATLYSLQTPFEFLFQEPTDFCSIDVGELRARFLLRDTEARAAVNSAAGGEHRCLEVWDDGSVCNSLWPSEKQLYAHIASAIGGSHGRANIAKVVTNTNYCVLCESTFRDTDTARQHIASSLRRNYCPKGRARFASPLIEPKLECVVCLSSFETAAEYFKHAREHIVPHLLPSFHIREAPPSRDGGSELASSTTPSWVSSRRRAAQEERENRNRGGAGRRGREHGHHPRDHAEPPRTARGQSQDFGKRVARHDTDQQKVRSTSADSRLLPAVHQAAEGRTRNRPGPTRVPVPFRGSERFAQLRAQGLLTQAAIDARGAAAAVRDAQGRGSRQCEDVGEGDDDAANLPEARERTQGAHFVQLPRRTRLAEGPGGPREDAEGHRAARGRSAPAAAHRDANHPPSAPRRSDSRGNDPSRDDAQHGRPDHERPRPEGQPSATAWPWRNY